MSIATTIEIEPGDTLDVPLQCRIRGGLAPAVFSVSDTLSGDIWQPRGSAALATLAASWYTAPVAGNPTQTGYDQGQVSVAIVNTLAASLRPGVTYTVNAYRVLASDATRTERIATIQLHVRPPSPP